MKQRTHLPAQYRGGKAGRNVFQQLVRPEFTGELDLREHQIGRRPALIATRPDGSEVLIVDRRVSLDAFDGDILRVTLTSLSDPVAALAPQTPKTWAKVTAQDDLRQAARVALAGWRGKFSYRAEDVAAGEKGLRSPQLGALFATLAHWTVAPEEPATVVMPTGTGKTETMLAILVERSLPMLMVVVPTSALRQQVAAKFVTLGMLKACEVLADDAPYPVVGTVEHQFDTEEEAGRFLSSCNVVVATMAALAGCTEEIRRKVAEHCTHLMVDEAHHVSAPTWDAFRQRFHGKPIVQFTATPFRNDGRHIGGRMIYTYPLRKAQQEGYFQRINFRPVFAYTDPDQAIAEAAVRQLRDDLDAGLDHLVMARVDSIARAEEVHARYLDAAPEFSPLVIHSRLGEGERGEALRRLRARESQIIVCVDMLGEGFDLPELKIAAMHDVHKSLAITLQFTGRFTRAKGDKVGEATVIANRASLDVQKSLRALYAEDADWNQVIRDLSQEATGGEQARSEFMREFGSLPAEVPIQNVEPKMSTVVYRTSCPAWDPGALPRLFPEDELLTKEIAVNERQKVAWFVTKERSPVGWGEVRELENVTYHLYALHWDEDRRLLFVNSSNNASLHEDLAGALTGDRADLIRGETIYRAMHGIQRMVPTNLGLSDLVSRARRFMMLVGSDVAEGFEPAQSQTKTKTNMFGFGFEHGERTSIGCSMKGRIWSYLIARDLSQWVGWCRQVGAKLLDDSISTDAVFRGFIKPKPVKERPPLVPLALEWPIAFLAEQEERITVRIGDTEAPFFETELEIMDPRKDGAIRFTVATEGGSAQYEAEFGAAGTRYVALGVEATVIIGRREKPLSNWFHQFAPKFHFEQDTFIEHDLLLHIERPITPLELEKIEDWDWTGIDIRKESQGPGKTPDTIQRRVIERLLASGEPWDVIFDDDDALEVADVVAIRMAADRLVVHLYHCKYSGARSPGARIEDMYVVCGQAQKSVYWRDRTGFAQLIPHLVLREQKRLAKGLATRFEKGDLRTLDEIGRRREVLRPEFKVFVVQPGLSKARASFEILELLAATSLYLNETFNVDFGVITSS